MAKYTDQEQAMILAAVFQAGQQCFDLAHYGQTELLPDSIATLFVDEPDSVLAVYGSLQAIKKGLSCLITQLSDPQKRNQEITLYSIRLLQLGRTLFKQPQKVESLVNDLQALHKHQLSLTSQYHRLGGLYQQYISPLSPRILVKGQPEYLQNEEIQAQIRSALLAGVRSAHLWYQCGGRRWHFLTRGGRLLRAAQDLFHQIA